jgi:hypothetical protein
MSDDKHKFSRRKMSLDQEQDRQENKLERDLEDYDSENVCGHDLSSPSLHLRARESSWDRLA